VRHARRPADLGVWVAPPAGGNQDWRTATGHLRPEKLHTTFNGVRKDGPVAARHYTLTHSDRTGDLFLSIAPEFDQERISCLCARLMRDEVLAEWSVEPGGPELHVHLHVSGGLVLGTAGWRDSIFRRHLPLVLEALRYGDRELFQAHPELDGAPIRVHYHSPSARYDRVESGGRPADHAVAQEQQMAKCS
jgi:hypothetical protein